MSYELEGPNETKIINLSQIPRSTNPCHQNHFLQEEKQKVTNPFFGAGQNILPVGLFEQISHLNYLSPLHLQKICWQRAVFVGRRSSMFLRHLQLMQLAILEQQIKIRSKNIQIAEYTTKNYHLNHSNSLEKNKTDTSYGYSLASVSMQEQGKPSSKDLKPSFCYSQMKMESTQRKDWDDYFES